MQRHIEIEIKVYCVTLIAQESQLVFSRINANLRPYIHTLLNPYALL